MAGRSEGCPTVFPASDRCCQPARALGARLQVTPCWSHSTGSQPRVEPSDSGVYPPDSISPIASSRRVPHLVSARRHKPSVPAAIPARGRTADDESMETRPTHRTRTAARFALIAIALGAAASCGSSAATPVVTVTSVTASDGVAVGGCPPSCRGGPIDVWWLRNLEATIRRLHFEHRMPSAGHLGPGLG